jgi:hypothetical protein
MPCFSPMQAIKLGVKANGKLAIHIYKTRFKNWSAVHKDVDLLLPCGVCVGCRLERSRQWAVRCVHEASLYERNCFVTLTFNDKSLLEREAPMSLDIRDFQLFMKRLRFEFGNGIRFFHCGEYGDRFRRPHYHACIFNFDFPDKFFWKESNGCRLYTSEILSRLWPFGFSSIGDVTFESAAYVARYIMKKEYGKRADEHYLIVDEDTGEGYFRKPEYTSMSRRPGIGSKWFDKFYKDCYPNDYVVMLGRGKCRPPRYYDSKFELLHEDVYLDLKQARVEAAEVYSLDQSPERLIVKGKVASAKLALFGRNVE